MAHRSKKKPPPQSSAVPTVARIPFWRSDWFLAIALAAVTIVMYFPAWDGLPIWDDAGHLTKPALRSLHGLWRIWVEPGAAQQYYPVVHSVFWLEYHLWGDSTFGYHLLNILLHAACALLIVAILRTLEIRGAWLAGALFALHPVQVESVAWMSELKNTLSGFFYLSSALLYFRFDQTRNRTYWGGAFVLFALGLLAKSVIATLPAALLVVLWWKRGKLSRQDLLPLLPFFFLCIPLGLFTAWMERKFIGAEGAAFNFSLIERTLIAGRAIWFYLSKLAWPQNLIFIYPRWQISQTIWWQYLFPAAVLGLIAVLWTYRKTARAPLAACLLFIGTLFPALGYFNIYPFAFSFVADHFQYLACIAPLSLAAAAAYSGIARMKSQAWIAQSLIGIVLAAFAVLSWQQSTMYADMKTLWDVTIDKNPDCWLAYSNRGFGLLQEGRVADAIGDFKAALNANPDYAYAHNNLGMALLQEGRIDDAVPHFTKALELKPDYAEPYDNLGTVYFQKGQVDASISSLQKAVAINPGYSDAHFNLGIAFRTKGDMDSAISEYQKCLESAPEDLDARRGLAAALLEKGRTTESIVQFQNVLATRPDNVDVMIDLGNAFLKAGQPSDAVGQFQKALSLRPTGPVADALRQQIALHQGEKRSK
jgi:tetratricopeptide (TPR) repeat protein